MIRTLQSGQYCLACGTQQNDRGFVDMIGEVNVTRDGFEITGVVDVVYCANCLEQAARLIGSASLDEVNNWSHKEYEYIQNQDKLKDEIAAWQQRMFQLANFTVEDFRALAEYEKADKDVPTASS